MKCVAMVVGLLVCNCASAATYVYQQNPNQQHAGKCGKFLQPFQLTITMQKAIPPNSNNLMVPLKTVSINAGALKYQWTQKYNKNRTNNAIFTADSNGDITAWAVDGGHRSSAVQTVNDSAFYVQDELMFNCGAEGSKDNPGTWARTQ
jgi:hypothetical protein